MTNFSETSVETVRTYWDERPCNIRHSPKPVGTKEYFDEVEARKYYVEPHIPNFAEFQRWRGKKVLEIGCGIGTDTVNFARNGAHVTAVELSETSLELARRRATLYGVGDHIDFVLGNAEQLSSLVMPDEYDLIYSFGVIHHSPHPEIIVDESRKFGGPGTVLKLMVYHRRSWKVLWIVVRYGRGRFWRAKELVARYSEAQTGCPVTYTYSRREAKELLQQGGYNVTNVDVEHIFPYRIKDYKEHRYVRVWYFRWMPRWFFSWLESRFGWHLCLTAVADQSFAGRNDSR